MQLITEEKVKAIAADRFGIPVEEITPKSNFKNLNADSLDIAEFIMEVEKEFKLSITDEQAEKLETIEEIVKFIETNTK